MKPESHLAELKEMKALKI